MSVIKVEDIAYVRFTAPDLDRMEEFLLDFGLVRAARTDTALYMRGTGPEPYAHVTHQGAPGFLGVAFRATSVADLEKLARAENRGLEALDGPGAGHVVSLSDPDGHRVQIVAGREPAREIVVTRAFQTNDAFGYPRFNQPKRVGEGPSRVKRLGHLVLGVSDFPRAREWWSSRLGFIASDEWPEQNPRGAFLRCDRGATLVDHHTVGLMSGGVRFGHAAFEVTDFDDLMRGNAHLYARTRQHEWGVGRHFLGSQIFDYWSDPWGHTVEHWTDGDLMDKDWGTRRVNPEVVPAVQWGEARRPR
ncbi:MAG: VOC family protein [Alphaproteobacteria bacterium]|nr:VOC family protein [Alphaproteobacteria bacterium]